ncbi:PAS domain S-box-containing protein [Thermoflavifilum aggregans]|uniref:histidine kinase n=1 Tax=Thermoflavifilum aggregans TaxID=454188 RepID=A0A2M9CXZ7_9BACT|nr:PAS domain S-box protein [Thermoflavifilum aggregans]PJJ76792.1 PAS domain S-box-containing protein [Thermoflavifilum aggregans]
MWWKRRFFLLILASLALYVYFLISLANLYFRFRAERELIQHTFAVLDEVRQLETYFYQPFERLSDQEQKAVYQQLQQHLERLQQLITNHPILLQRIDSLHNSLRYYVATQGIANLPYEQINRWEATLYDIKKEENDLLYQGNQVLGQVSRRMFVYALVSSFCFLSIMIAGLCQFMRDNEKRKKAEQEALANEARYRKLIEGVRVVVFTTDLDGRFTFISKRVQQLTGYKAEELLNRSYKTLVLPEWHERVTQFYRRQFENKINDTTLDFPIITKDGKEKWVRMYSTLLFEGDEPAGLQCVVVDTSERKEMLMRLRRAEREKRENQYLLEALMDNISSLIFIKDMQHRYRYVNKAFKEVLQVTEEIYGKTDFEFAAPELAKRYHESDDRIYQGASMDKSDEIIYVKGEPRHFLVTKFPLKDGYQRIFGICGIATDITDLIQYQQQLVEAKQRAEEAEKFQEQFLTTISHEMRTPLQGIVGMTFLLSSSSLTAEQQEYLRSIQEAVDTLLTLINDLLDLSKIKAGKLEFEHISFSLKDVLQSVDHLFHFRAEEKKLSFNIVCAPDVPDRLIGDPHRLKQVLVNLVGNAMKFTEKGFIRITVDATPADQENHILLHISVADSGIGIPAQQLGQIFESFSQAEAAISRKYGGSGLGLTITRHLVKLQHGQIEVNSEPGKGTVFTIRIPYEIDKQHPKSQGEKEISFPAYSLKGMRILVAEDNYINQKFISRLLQRLGASVSLVDNGHEVISQLRQQPDYDLLLIDMRMPVMNGYEAIHVIRQEMKLSIPIIAMTAAILGEDEEKAYAEGANASIRKPFTPQNFLQVIHQVLPQIQPVNSVYQDGVPRAQQQHGYDLSTLRELDDDQYLLEVLDLFLQTAPLSMDEIEKAYQQNDFESLREKAHRLKSSLGLLNMHELLDLMKQIEMQAKEKQTEGLGDRIQQARNQLNHILAYLQQEANILKKQNSSYSS